eukprot:gene893-1395_t
MLEDLMELMMARTLHPGDVEERQQRKEECVQVRTRLKRKRTEMESEARRNLTLRSGSGGLPPALFEGVMTGVYTVAVTGGRDSGTARVDPAMDYLRELGIAIPQEMYGEQFLEMIRNRRQRAVDSNPSSVRIPREHLQPVTTVNSETETEAIISESESDAETELTFDGSE